MVFTLISHMKNIYLLLHTLKHPYLSIHSFWQVLCTLHHYIMYRSKSWFAMSVVKQHLISYQCEVEDASTARHRAQILRLMNWAIASSRGEELC